MAAGAAFARNLLRSRDAFLPNCFGAILLSLSFLSVNHSRQPEGDSRITRWSEHVTTHLSHFTELAASSLSAGSVRQAQVARWDGIMDRQEKQFGVRILQVGCTPSPGNVSRTVLTLTALVPQKSVAHAGTGLRLQRVLRKLARGEPLVTSTLGGSGAVAVALFVYRQRPDNLACYNRHSHGGIQHALRVRQDPMGRSLIQSPQRYISPSRPCIHDRMRQVRYLCWPVEIVAHGAVSSPTEPSAASAPTSFNTVAQSTWQTTRTSSCG